jgi:hypothetical protein
MALWSTGSRIALNQDRSILDGGFRLDLAKGYHVVKSRPQISQWTTQRGRRWGGGAGSAARHGRDGGSSE